MKIVLTIGGLVYGGAERVMSNLANSFAESGHETTLITIHSKDPAYQLNENITFINGLNWKGKLSFFSVCKEYRNLIKKTKPDVILTFLTQVNEFVLFSTLGMSVPVIVSERNDPAHSAPSRFRRVVRRLLYPYADGVVFQTEDAKNYFNGMKIKSSKIIQNPIFISPEELTNNNAAEKMIITAGRLTEAKNQKLLIDAFADIADAYPEYKLVIYGEGNLRSELESRVEEYGLENRITLPGNTDKLHHYMKHSEIFVLSSNYEGMPNVLMEAMSCGMACISTDCPCGGPRFLIEDGKNGLLVPVGDEESLSGALEKLLNCNELRYDIGINAKKIYDNLNPEIICKKWENYLFEVSKKGI